MHLADLPSPDVEPPEGLVWHYTDGHGLASILRDHLLWATSAEFLNDAGEVELGVQLLLDELGRRAESEGGVWAELHENVRAKDLRAGPSPGTFFVLSAAQHWDLLAMWRCYGGLGESYAIGLDPTQRLAVLSDTPPGERLVLRQRAWSPVRYSERSQRELVDAVFSADVPAELTRLRDAVDSGAEKNTRTEALAELLDDMEQALLLIKHAGFTDERETRHCTVLYRDHADPGRVPAGMIRYRPTRYGMAPYLCLTGQRPGGTDAVTPTAAPLPIRAVAISPSANGGSATASLRDMLGASGYRDVPVLRSSIPFRG